MNRPMTKTRHELIKQHIDSFPVLPLTVTRLMKVTSDPESSARDVMETIFPDQSLCLTILKIANSVLFGRPQKVDSIQMAITILGFREVQRIAMAKAVINSFSKLSKHHKPFIDKIWIHSFVCGLAARNVAQDLRISADTAFTGGLIHDIGKLIMLETFGDDYTVEYWMTKFSEECILKEELEMFSFTHDQVGGQLLKKWFFPENLISAVSNHHSPAEANEGKELAIIIQLADFLSFFCCNQESFGDDDVLTAMHTSLPHIQATCQNLHLPVDDDKITGWFSWILENHQQGLDLKDAFSN